MQRAPLPRLGVYRHHPRLHSVLRVRSCRAGATCPGWRSCAHPPNRNQENTKPSFLAGMLAAALSREHHTSHRRHQTNTPLTDSLHSSEERRGSQLCGSTQASCILPQEVSECPPLMATIRAGRLSPHAGPISSGFPGENFLKDFSKLSLLGHADYSPTLIKP